jgi:hypothetical protein
MDVSGIAGAKDTDPGLRRPRYEPNDMFVRNSQRLQGEEKSARAP